MMMMMMMMVLMIIVVVVMMVVFHRYPCSALFQFFLPLSQKLESGWNISTGLGTQRDRE